MEKRINNFKFFLILFSLYILSVFINNYFLGMDRLVYNDLIESFTQDQVDAIIANQKKWEWLGFVIIPLIIITRSSLVAICLSVGAFFYDLDKDLKFKLFLNITLQGEFVLVLVVYFKLFYFAFVKNDFVLRDVEEYYPLSYINFLDIGSLTPWLIYPLQTINLFEVVYFFVLVYGLHKLLKNKYWKSFEIVAVSYGTGLAIWLGLVMFLILNIT
ncbi:hypothetical protein F7018_04920 [Tenacibaculum aiptasiae]|uniref:Yip1 domain-containing protein n=1 Tax=Tenacibaculum aiptasiae TaxID=426481 RepID=A0A7J5APX3_9FLAO|nr:hypothetical protein [Tenacibaculum aiptasiae]KAB1159655.1 hypothetical protein F7018_04920 [Tenacibaculum aiptasiae]